MFQYFQKIINAYRDMVGGVDKRHRDEYYHGPKRFQHRPDMGPDFIGRWVVGKKFLSSKFAEDL